MLIIPVIQMGVGKMIRHRIGGATLKRDRSWLYVCKSQKSNHIEWEVKKWRLVKYYKMMGEIAGAVHSAYLLHAFRVKDGVRIAFAKSIPVSSRAFKRIIHNQSLKLSIIGMILVHDLFSD
ncbi:hypothetical protein SUGI_0950910 [Cryptomeria japonica]|nr:hypothetical protein SUGI_0950910 [Cryptomeria japonica]